MILVNVATGSATPMRGKSLTCRPGSSPSPGLWPAVVDRRVFIGNLRQVEDLPRIGVAEPLLK